jgi:hypothetical protein
MASIGTEDVGGFANRIYAYMWEHAEDMPPAVLQTLRDIELVFGKQKTKAAFRQSMSALHRQCGGSTHTDLELEEDLEAFISGEELLTIIGIVVGIVSIVVTTVAIIVTFVFAPENCDEDDENPYTEDGEPNPDAECAWVEEEQEVEIDMEVEVPYECTVLTHPDGTMEFMDCEYGGFDFAGYDIDMNLDLDF